MSQSREDVRNDVQEVLRAVMGDQEIIAVDTLDAKQVQNWDSMNHVNLIVSLESEFEIRFGHEEISKIENVGQLIDLIVNKIN